MLRLWKIKIQESDYRRECIVMAESEREARDVLADEYKGESYAILNTTCLPHNPVRAGFVYAGEGFNE